MISAPIGNEKFYRAEPNKKRAKTGIPDFCPFVFRPEMRPYLQMASIVEGGFVARL